MDNKQWKMLKSRLIDELHLLLSPLESLDWNTTTNVKANSILSKRAEQLLIELGLPSIPEGHKLFAKIWFNDKVVPAKMKLNVYHVAWNKGIKNTSNPVSKYLKTQTSAGLECGTN